MSKAHPSTAKASPAHIKMLDDCVAKGWIKRVGDTFEITPAGHEYTMRTMREVNEHALTSTGYGDQYTAHD